MKYLMLLHANPSAFAEQSPEEMQAAMKFFDDLYRETSASGELVDTGGLADAARATTFRRQHGVAIATDGPFAETKELLASYAIYDLGSQERANELAAQVATATGGVVEVWPVMEFGGMEM